MCTALQRKQYLCVLLQKNNNMGFVYGVAERKKKCVHGVTGGKGCVCTVLHKKQPVCVRCYTKNRLCVYGVTQKTGCVCTVLHKKQAVCVRCYRENKICVRCYRENNFCVYGVTEKNILCVNGVTDKTYV